MAAASGDAHGSFSSMERARGRGPIDGARGVWKPAVSSPRPINAQHRSSHSANAPMNEHSTPAITPSLLTRVSVSVQKMPVQRTGKLVVASFRLPVRQGWADFSWLWATSNFFKVLPSTQC
ncbi:hypothetical protein TNCV_2985721 [Trichonephila clavipes]|nr:hypothetical protein TNCV_2985721 [Trichonephila clavipes]